jgi:hypothetical protein
MINNNNKISPSSTSTQKKRGEKTQLLTRLTGVHILDKLE